MIIDTHCHYCLPPLFDDFKKHQLEAQNKQVIAAICPSVDVKSAKDSLALADNQYIFPAIGFHPLHKSENIEKDLNWLKNTISDHPEIIALGEIGIDYFRLDIDSIEGKKDRKRQLDLFESQLSIAKVFHLPVLIHIRDKNHLAYSDTYERLEATNFDQPCVFHCISGPSDIHLSHIKESYYYSVAGNCTYPSAHDLRSLISKLPPNKLLTETDAPYLAPQSYRGKTCEPWMISETAQVLSEITNQSLDSFAQNAISLFPKLSAALSNKFATMTVIK